MTFNDKGHPRRHDAPVQQVRVDFVVVVNVLQQQLRTNLTLLLAVDAVSAVEYLRIHHRGVVPTLDNDGPGKAVTANSDMRSIYIIPRWANCHQ